MAKAKSYSDGSVLNSAVITISVKRWVMCTRTIRAHAHAAHGNLVKWNRNWKGVVIIHYIRSQSNYCSHICEAAVPNT